MQLMNKINAAFICVIFYFFGLYLYTLVWEIAVALTLSILNDQWGETGQTIISLIHPGYLIYYIMYAMPILGIMTIFSFTLFFILAVTWLRKKQIKLYFRLYCSIIILTSIPFTIWYIELSDQSYAIYVSISVVISSILFMLFFNHILLYLNRKLISNIID